MRPPQQPCNLVFAMNNEGNFFAPDATTGKLLWEFIIGRSDAESNPITYEVDGKQYVLAAAGATFVAFALP
jgi:alcohol dehydrogenase (cytochrome c)